MSVDDNDAMLFARSQLLRQEGFEVVEARSGNEALRLLEMIKPALVLLDVNLPDMSGVDLARRIRSDINHQKVKIIQLSATFSNFRDVLEGLQGGGADLYLTEPLPPGKLLSAVERLLAS